MKVYVLDTGSMWLDENLFVSGSHQASSKNQRPATDWVELPVSVFLIDHPDGKILYDTGCDGDQYVNVDPNRDSISPYVFTEEQLLPNRLKALNVAYDDIKSIVLSHLHADHAGNVHLFKNTEIYVSDTELTQTLRKYALREQYGAYSFKNAENYLAAALRWNLIPDDVQEIPLAKGVTIVNLGSGHGYGMLALLLELPNTGNWLLCADAVYTDKNMGPPVRLPGIFHDSLGYRRTIEFIRRYAKAHNARVIYGHNQAQAEEFRKNSKGYFD